MEKATNVNQKQKTKLVKNNRRRTKHGLILIPVKLINPFVDASWISLRSCFYLDEDVAREAREKTGRGASSSPSRASRNSCNLVRGRARLPSISGATLSAGRARQMTHLGHCYVSPCLLLPPLLPPTSHRPSMASITLPLPLHCLTLLSPSSYCLDKPPNVAMFLPTSFLPLFPPSISSPCLTSTFYGPYKPFLAYPLSVPTSSSLNKHFPASLCPLIPPLHPLPCC